MRKQFTSENDCEVILYHPKRYVPRCTVYMEEREFNNIPIEKGKFSQKSLDELSLDVFENGQKIELYVVSSPRNTVVKKVCIQEYTGRRCHCLLKYDDLLYEFPSYSLSLSLNSLFIYSIVDSSNYPYDLIKTRVSINILSVLILTTVLGVLAHYSDKGTCCRKDIGKLRATCLMLTSPVMYTKLFFKKTLHCIVGCFCRKRRKKIKYFPCCPYTNKDEDCFIDKKKPEVDL
ncbi:MAG: hypothetical protein AAF335_03395 [Bacteroidota bacterium]